MYIVGDKDAVPLSETVRSGQVQIDPTAGEDLRKQLQAQIDQVDTWIQRANTSIARPAPLGANPVGDKMRDKFTHRAEGEQYSFVSVMTAYRTVLEQTKNSIVEAIGNFQALDEDQQAELKKHMGNS
ncbi:MULTISPECIES: hypothetical protein [Lentzea]|uniref:PE family protein n=1 Tax=Lentzea albida TaxID=65499 RepID=A0A1H9SKB1_9PSEU|nr:MULTISPECIES: hypothetical protein [Lentzea]USX55031.1 hypothetical protein ND450_13290 [Lentzea sp. HUAS12]SER85374.1 hypothetical protein SAMN04488000_112188 [Lentzea albida]